MHNVEPTVRQILERADGGALSYGTNRFYQGWAFRSDALAEKYDTDWLARRIVETWARQGLRRGFLVKDDPDQKIVREFRTFNNTPMSPDGVLMNALFKAQLYGGSAIWPLTVEGDPETPLGEGETVLTLEVLRRNQLAEKTRQTDKNEPDFGQITEYVIAGDHPRAGQLVHASRLLIFGGLAKETRWRFYDPEGPKWPWISALQPVDQAICDFGATWRNVSRLIEEYSVGVVKLQGLIRSMSDVNSSEIEDRLTLIARMISTQRKVILDAGGAAGAGEESFSRTTVSFSDIPALMVQYSQLVSGASGIPVTVLMGMSPAGMNATGESDLTQFYDRVQTYRENEIEPNLLKLLRLITGKEELEIEWPSLWEPSDTEKADVRLKNAQADRVYIDAFALEPKQVTKARAEDGSLGLDIDPEEIESAEPKDPEADPDALDPTGTEGDAPKVEAGGGLEGAPAGEDIQGQALNGAQITGAIEIVTAMAEEKISRESAKALLLLSFPTLTPESAEELLGPQDFEPKAEPAPAAFGAGPPGTPPAAPGGKASAGAPPGPRGNGKPAGRVPPGAKGNARGGNGGAAPVAAKRVPPR